MQIKESDFINGEGKGYVSTSYTDKILNKIQKNVYDYKKEEVEEMKKKIIKDIKNEEKKIYYLLELKNKFKIKVRNGLNNIAEKELKELILAIKERYIYEEAINSLVTTNKLIPIRNTYISAYDNCADIAVNLISSIEGTKCLYIYLDLIDKNVFRVTSEIIDK